MSLFLNRDDFERSCRHAGITDMAYDADRGEYTNVHTQKTYLVWESLAQSKHATSRPTAYVLRRRGKNQGLNERYPYANIQPDDWAKLEAKGWEQPLALWPAMPITSASEDAILSERQRQQRVKGYHPVMDQRYKHDELLRAAAAYLLQILMPDYAPTMWPWPSVPMREEPRLRAIEKSAALLIAEHQRVMTMTVGV